MLEEPGPVRLDRRERVQVAQPFQHRAQRRVSAIEAVEDAHGVTGASRVVIVEDKQMFRETLELLLGLRNDIDNDASVGSGNEAPEVCAELRPDVVLLD